MGRVFSFEELSARQVPDEGTFDIARATFSAEVEEAAQNGLVRGAMIFGSAAIRRTNSRSDLDCFIVLTDDEVTSWQAARTIVERTNEASAGLIPIGAIARSSLHLESGRHEMDRFFGAHLAGPHRLVVGEDPAKFLSYSDDPAIEILEDFLISKSRKFSEYGWLDDAKEKLRTLQRVLELPNAVGRKALRALDEIEGTSRSIENSADKGLVGGASAVLFSELGTQDHAARLFQLDAQYNEVVAAVLAGDMSKKEYKAALKEIADNVIPSIGWLIKTYEAFEDRVRDQIGPIRTHY